MTTPPKPSSTPTPPEADTTLYEQALSLAKQIQSLTDHVLSASDKQDATALSQFIFQRGEAVEQFAALLNHSDFSPFNLEQQSSISHIITLCQTLDEQVNRQLGQNLTILAQKLQATHKSRHILNQYQSRPDQDNSLPSVDA